MDKARMAGMKSSRMIILLGMAVLLGQFLGCCRFPKRGVTVRGGLDFRERLKPSGFVEMVDTEWDEMRRNDDLRWLENSGCQNDFLTEESSMGVPESATVLPVLKSPSSAESSPPRLPRPELLQEDEPSGLDELFEPEEPADSLSTDHADKKDYQEMIELTRFETKVKTTANRPASIEPSAPSSRKKNHSRNWMWSKP